MMNRNNDTQKEDALMRQFSLLREDVPDDLHARIVQVATHMPQRQSVPAAAPRAWQAWAASLLPDMRTGLAFACTVFALVGLLGLHLGQSQHAAPQDDEDIAVIFSMIDGDIGWEEWS